MDGSATHVAGLDAAAQDAAIEKFVAAKGGTPIIENQTRLIFLVKDKDGVAPRIVGDFNGWATTAQGYDVSIGQTTRLEGTSWSYLESTLYTNARLEYVFFSTRRRPGSAESTHRPGVCGAAIRSADAVLGRAARSRRARARRRRANSSPKRSSSRSLGGTRRVWFYLPPGYAAAKDTLFPVIYVLDGSNYVEKMDVPKVLDHLIANKSIPPVIAVFSEPADRQEEYSRNPKWRAFIANELVPLVDKRFRTFPTPDHRVILGSSLAAYGAIDLAVAAPSVFGLCAAIAPPVQTATVVSNQPTARAAVVSIKFFVMGGVYDSMIDGARRLRTTLDEYQAPVSYLEVSEGHNTNTFRGHLDDALKALLPSQ